MSDKKEYVLGFMFGGAFKEVVLIRKNKPEFQKGKLNGVGGKIEPTDKTPYVAMVREFEEETGVKTRLPFWKHYATMEFPYARVFCFAHWGGYMILETRTTTDEPVEVVSIRDNVLSSPSFLPNLRWLVPMAINALRTSVHPVLTITEGAADYASLQHDAQAVK